MSFHSSWSLFIFSFGFCVVKYFYSEMQIEISLGVIYFHKFCLVHKATQIVIFGYKVEFCIKVTYFRSSDQVTSYLLLFQQDFFDLDLNKRVVSFLKMDKRLIGGHTDADDDARTRSYLAEMRKEMAARSRERR